MYYCSRTFVTDFRAQVGRKLKDIIKSTNLDALNFDDAVSYSHPVNRNITCPHGNLAINGSSNRIVRLVSRRAWNIIKSLFPDAIEHKIACGDPDIGKCEICQETVSNDMFLRDALRKWVKDTLDHPICSELYKRKSLGFPIFDSNLQQDCNEAVQKSCLFLLDRGCLNEWRTAIENARSGKLPKYCTVSSGPDVSIISTHTSSSFVCPHDKLRLPPRLRDTLLDKKVDKGRTTDIATPDILGEFVSELEYESLQQNISSLRKVVEEWALNAEGISEASSFIELRSHARIFLKDSEQESMSNSPINDSEADVSIFNKYVFEPELCMHCFNETATDHQPDGGNNGSDQKSDCVLTFIRLQSDEEIPTAPHGDTGRPARRSRRGKKQHKLNLKVHDSLAKLRLLLMEQIGLSVVGQELILARHYQALPFSSNDKSLEELGIKSGDVLYVRHPLLFDDNGRKNNTRERQRSKEELEQEMMESLLDINSAFERKNGCSDSYPVKAQAGWNAERGFTGTLLQSTKVTNAEELSMEESAADKGG